jgi:hypothetical protein
MSIGNILLTVVAILFGLYEIGYGFYAYRLNGFKFYITAGFLVGLPFIVVGADLIMKPKQPQGGWEGLIFLMWLFGVLWKTWRKQIARRSQPQKWEKWEHILNGNKTNQ